MTEEEIWKYIPGFLKYQASTHGRIKTCRIGKTKILKSSRRTDGYSAVKIYKSRKSFVIRTHILVAATFIGPRPDGLVVHHRDGNKTNNHINNLEYATLSENRAYAHRKLTKDDVLKIRKRWEKSSEKITKFSDMLAEEHDVCRSTIRCILRNKSWKETGNENQREKIIIDDPSSLDYYFS